MFHITAISVFHKQKNLLVFLYFITFGAYFQNLIGIVLEKKADGKTEILIGATLRWKNANNGVFTDSEGKFTLVKSLENYELIISSVGYKTDTIMVHSVKTLGKATCCNLSESFETSASVSVSYADAVTGSKQI